jgi:hypothetical protein
VTAPAWRPVGFLLLMFGFGVRLDTGWQGVAWVLLAAGVLSLAAAAWTGSPLSAFVPGRGKR